MTNHLHAPADYLCPICLGNQGQENDQTLLKQADLVYQDELVVAWINSFWVGRNDGHVIIVPRDHYETIYDLPDKVGAKIFWLAKRISRALKETHQCQGTTLRQNNEPAGDQHAFHYHLHIFPRYQDDNFNQDMGLNNRRLSKPQERVAYAKKVRQALENL